MIIVYNFHYHPFFHSFVDTKILLFSGVSPQITVLDESGSTKTCKKQKSKYPLRVGGVTGVFTEGRMIVCGGSTGGTSVISACYDYKDDQQGWTKLTDMYTPRRGSSSLSIPGGIFVTGGWDGTIAGELETSELIYFNGTKKKGKSLPDLRYAHCMVEYHGQIISTGGINRRGPTKSVWSFNNHVEFTFTNMSSMNYARFWHGCGIVHSIHHELRPLLVVAGSTRGSGQYKSEYWDFTVPGSQWQVCSKSSFPLKSFEIASF